MALPSPGTQKRAAKARGGSDAIRLRLVALLQHRDIVLRAVSAACKLVTPRPFGPAWNEFQQQVVSAVSEAFNNLVIHGYPGRSDGQVDISIRTGHGSIEIEMRDWGKGFNPTAVPLPELDTLPESGLGLYIMQSFMQVGYRRGRPNVLKLGKTLEDPS
jgi:anti-sigma regulatory factor (Ser/Thr protein kinase)